MAARAYCRRQLLANAAIAASPRICDPHAYSPANSATVAVSRIAAASAACSSGAWTMP